MPQRQRARQPPLPPRAKYIPKERSPDGGDGGRGGHIIPQRNRHLWTLPRSATGATFATNGESGGAGRPTARTDRTRLGRCVGTAVFDADSGEFLCEVTEDGQTINPAPRRQGSDPATGISPHPPTARPATRNRDKPAIEKVPWCSSLKLPAMSASSVFPNAGKSTPAVGGVSRKAQGGGLSLHHYGAEPRHRRLPRRPILRHGRHSRHHRRRLGGRVSVSAS